MDPTTELAEALERIQSKADDAHRRMAINELLFYLAEARQLRLVARWADNPPPVTTKLVTLQCRCCQGQQALI